LQIGKHNRRIASPEIQNSPPPNSAYLTYPCAEANKRRKYADLAIRTCTVSCEDSDGHQHSLEVTAETLYEAVAQALAAFESNEWVGQIGRGHTITVRVQQPAVGHRVRILDFEKWLGTNGKSPAEMVLKSRLRSLLGPS
jgi:hypothetical protein